ncbi:MAG: TolC family protein [Nitrospirota bacterium]
MVSARLRFKMFAVIVTFLQATPVTAQDTGHWTLETAVRRVFEVAPEHRSSEAEIDVRMGELTHAKAWPNPTVELRADDKLGQETGRGGNNLTEISISQPLPFRRLARQQAVAEANLRGAQEVRRYQRLMLERETARVFHALQLTGARVELARGRLELTEGYGRSGPGNKTRDPLVRYLTPLDRVRLAVMREEAEQAVSAAEKDHLKALAAFRSMLALPPDAAVRVPQLEIASVPPELSGLDKKLDTHPLIAAKREEMEAARRGIALAESLRLADPALNLFFERDYINGERSNVIGIGVSVQFPFWNQNRGPVAQAKAEAKRTEAQSDIQRRDSLLNLRQGHADLLRLIEQARRTYANLLEPAHEVYELTRRGFAAGESNILALVDANNIYFDTRTRYIELLRETLDVAADLRLAAGSSIVELEARP